MGRWQNADEINAQLRKLTEETKKLREEMNRVRPSASDRKRPTAKTPKKGR
jgi:hypothetical protein